MSVRSLGIPLQHGRGGDVVLSEDYAGSENLSGPIATCLEVLSESRSSLGWQCIRAPDVLVEKFEELLMLEVEVWQLA